ncbi:MAG: DUF2470 domain-containing protein [Elusimicrobia bacterium]|nr:DUF2470 domain-containing protein [Elusimicrobiota bacterium]
MAQTPNHGHSRPTEPEDPSPAPETSHAERARTLLHSSRLGVLSTHSQKCPGHPFGSTMPYAVDARGRPLFLISGMAMHTQNLAANPKASLFVTVPEAHADPLGAARLTVVGTAAVVPEGELPEARAGYLALHENAKYYVDFKDFAFWRLEAADLYYVGGFGVMGWVEAEDFTAAAPDPLAGSAAGILSHMNADHEAAMLDLARHLKGIPATEAAMTSVDRWGFHLRLKTPERVRSVRIGFPSEVRTAEDCRKTMAAMLKEIPKA